MQREKLSYSAVSMETSAVPMGTEMGDSSELSCFGTGRLGLYASACIHIPMWPLREGGMILGKAETANDDMDVTSQHPSQIPKLFLFCFSLLGSAVDILSSPET